MAEDRPSYVGVWLILQLEFKSWRLRFPLRREHHSTHFDGFVKASALVHPLSSSIDLSAQLANTKGYRMRDDFTDACTRFE